MTGKTEKVAEMYSDDAMEFPPNEVGIMGKQAISENWQRRNFTYFEFIRKQEPRLSISGNSAYEIDMDYTVKYRTEEDKEIRGGDIRFKQVRIWKKQSNGSWKLYLEMWSSNHEIPSGT